VGPWLLVRDRVGQFTGSFDTIFPSVGIQAVKILQGYYPK
jgi:hypothetical protein